MIEVKEHVINETIRMRQKKGEPGYDARGSMKKDGPQGPLRSIKI